MSSAYPFIAALVAYLIGSISFAVVVSRAMGLKDPRTYGSQNPGATNVLRSGSKVAAILTLVLDALKGFVPVVLVHDSVWTLASPDHVPTGSHASICSEWTGGASPVHATAPALKERTKKTICAHRRMSRSIVRDALALGFGL
jgi:hypothetical protein